MLPVSYSLRNLSRRRFRTLLTLAGVTIVVLLISILSAFHRSITQSFERAADPAKIYLISHGAESDPIRSAIERGEAEQAAADLPAIYEDENGRHVSVEVHQVTTIRVPTGSAAAGAGPPRTSTEASASASASASADSDSDESAYEEVTAIMRGITPKAFLFHDDALIVEGREPRGDFEVLVGDLAAERMGVPRAALGVGSSFAFEGATWNVVGRFVAPGQPIEAELWFDLDDLMTVSRRTDVTLVAARLASPEDVDLVDLVLNETRQDLQLIVQTEEQWYAELLRLMEPIALIVQALGALVLIGGVIGSANTLYAAAIGRTQEMAVLQTLGYRRLEIALGLLIESLMIALLGGLIGVALAAAVGDVAVRLPMGAIRVAAGPSDIWVGLAAAGAIGVAGTIVPAWRVAQTRVLDALQGSS